MAGSVPTGNHGPAATFPGAGRMLLLLIVINLFNYIDRQVLSATLPLIELDLLLPNDPNLNLKLGWLTSAFLVVYMLAAPVFGVLGDKLSRWFLVGVGVILWSLASGGSGLATTYWILLATRCLVGVGEAAYGPVAPSMISDMYPTEHRGRILSWFYMAIPVGSALGFVLGGLIAGSFGWRAAFYAVTIPGILLGLICFTMKEPPRFKAPAAMLGDTYMQRIRKIWAVRSFRYCTLGMTCSTFVLGGVAAFAPKYIFERTGQLQITDHAIQKMEGRLNTQKQRLVPDDILAKLRIVRTAEPLGIPEFRVLLQNTLTPEEIEQYYRRIVDDSKPVEMKDGKAVLDADGNDKPIGMTLGMINLIFGAIVVVAGLVATLLGGMLGDYMKQKMRGAYFLVCGYSALIAFPLFLGMILVPFPYAWGFLFLAVFGLFFNTGPANAITANVIHSSVRASGFALNILVIHLFGDVISPPIIGWLADSYGWQQAMIFTSLFIFAAGIFWTVGWSSLDEDTRKVEGE